LSLLWLLACPGPPVDTAVGGGHGPVAAEVSAALGEPVPYATEEQLETFERGRAVAERTFTRSEGLGPSFNVASCRGCHEKPVTGGSGGLYRNFFLIGRVTDDGAFFPLDVGGTSSGVVRLYSTDDPAKPALPEDIEVVTQRNPIPFFGVGLLAELPEESILANADPDDLDGDGISGRPNYDRGYVGRFGRKAQTVSIEGFIRGPLFNHLGLTSDPLSNSQRADLPVDSSVDGGDSVFGSLLSGVRQAWAQAAAPDGPLTDDDGVPDPELSTEDLFDLVSFAMLLAAPQLDEPSDSSLAGQEIFDQVDCGACHVPRLEGPRGPLPVYSDLLLHDMGEELADGFPAGEASGSEFRTQPLWGIAAVGPYLHDGRASSLHEAILLHGGEASASRDAYARLSEADQACLEDFLLSLGGADQASAGLLPPGDPTPEVGDWGGPSEELPELEQARFEAGRQLFDREFLFSEGTGGPRFNGDSCRACHFQPVLGGSGPPGVDVMRHGLVVDGSFATPAIGTTVLHRETALPGSVNRPQAEADVFERRQTPALFGLGLLDALEDEDILALADPFDLDGDGVSGRPNWTEGGRLGRFGWKAQVPSLEEFSRDAFSVELGLSLPYQEGLVFGALQDDDGVPDPELDASSLEAMTDYLRALGPPPRDGQPPGEDLFEQIGCAACHAQPGGVPAYTDLLLHDLGQDLGIEDAAAGMGEFRTPPLWGLRATAPYLHDGSADTLVEAIAGHEGEGRASREAFEGLSETEREEVLTWLSSL
jgi:CxxC motif-containing protein (DUF1111 family)